MFHVMMREYKTKEELEEAMKITFGLMLLKNAETEKVAPFMYNHNKQRGVVQIFFQTIEVGHT